MESLENNPERKILDPPDVEEPKRTHEFLDPEKASIDGLLDLPPKPRPYLVKKHFPEVPLVVVAAPGGTGKGFYCLQLAISLATKRPFLGNPEFQIPKRGETIILSLEDDRRVFHERLGPCFLEMTRGMDQEQRDQAREEMYDSVIIPPSGGKAFPLFPEYPKNVEELVKFASQYQYLKAIVLDPLNLLSMGDFTENLTASRIAAVCREIHDRTRATVILLSHTTKAGMARDGNGESSGDSLGVLGAVSLLNASRMALTMRLPGPKFLAALGLERAPENYVLVRNVKCNYLPPRDRTILLERTENGPFRFIPMESPDPMEHARGMAEMIRENPGIGKTDALAKYVEQAGVSRAKADMALEEAIQQGMVNAKARGKNNKTELHAKANGEVQEGGRGGENPDAAPFD